MTDLRVDVSDGGHGVGDLLAQKFPAASEAVEVPVVIGAKATVSRPLKFPSSGGHSIVVCADPTPPLHGAPFCCP